MTNTKPAADGDKKKVSITWAFSSFLESMRNFANTEHKHNSLGFLRKSGPDHALKEYKVLLDKLQVNQRDIAQIYVLPEASPTAMRQLCACCIGFVHVRRDIVSMYSEIMNARTPSLELLEGYGLSLQSMVGKLKKDMQFDVESSDGMHPSAVLDSLQVGMMSEISTFAALMLAHCSISYHHFKDTIVRLSRAQTDLRTWKQCFTAGHHAHAAAAATVETSNTVPKIFTVLFRVYQLLVNKARIYFFLSLQKPVISDVGAAAWKDEILRQLVAFYQKIGACLLSLHRSPDETGCLSLTGYEHPESPREPLSGLKSFPAILSIPSGEPVPTSHMVTIFSLATDESANLRADEVVFFDESDYKSKARADKFAYYLSRVDEHVTVAIVLPLKGRRGVEKDQNRKARQFISDFSKTMRSLWAVSVAHSQ